MGWLSPKYGFGRETFTDPSVPSAPPLGVLEFSSDLPRIQLTALLWGRWKVVSGYGGFVTTDRPGRRAWVDWRGHDPLRLGGSVLFDQVALARVRGVGVPAPEHRSVEPAIRRLERMATSPGANKPPPALTVNGNLPHDIIEASQLRWGIETLEWGDLIKYDGGDRIRQDAAVTLIQLTGYTDQVKASAAEEFRDRQQAAAARDQQRAQAQHDAQRVYVVKDSDKTLRAVAARALGDADKWKQIAELNGIRDPKAIRAGQRLRMP
jgi:hypothetical protein